MKREETHDQDEVVNAETLPTKGFNGSRVSRSFRTRLAAEIYAFRSGMGIRLDDQRPKQSRYLVVDTSNSGYSHYVLVVTKVKRHPFSLASEVEQAMKEKPHAHRR